MANTDTDQLGPIDYTVIEFPGSQFNGEVIPALNDLIAAGLVRILDVAFVAKDEDGNVLMAELEELGDLGPLAGLAWYFWLGDAPQAVGAIMLFAAGGILYAVVEDIAPQAHLERRWAPPLGAIAGFLLGMIGDSFVRC